MQWLVSFHVLAAVLCAETGEFYEWKSDLGTTVEAQLVSFVLTDGKEQPVVNPLLPMEDVVKEVILKTRADKVIRVEVKRLDKSSIEQLKTVNRKRRADMAPKATAKTPADLLRESEPLPPEDPGKYFLWRDTKGRRVIGRFIAFADDVGFPISDDERSARGRKGETRPVIVRDTRDAEVTLECSGESLAQAVKVVEARNKVEEEKRRELEARKTPEERAVDAYNEAIASKIMERFATGSWRDKRDLLLAIAYWNGLVGGYLAKDQAAMERSINSVTSGIREKARDLVLYDVLGEQVHKITDRYVTGRDLWDAVWMYFTTGKDTLSLLDKPTAPPKLPASAKPLLPSGGGEPVKPALVARWDFEDAADDAGPMKATAANPRAVRYGEGKHGRALVVTTSSDCLRVENGGIALAEGDFTVSAFVKLRDVSKSSPLVSHGGYNWKHGWIVDVLPGGIVRLETSLGLEGGNGSVQTEKNALKADRWHHVAVVVRRQIGKTRIFVDGVVSASDTVRGGNLDNPQAPLLIGGCDQFRLNGAVDDVRLFSGALDDAAVMALRDGSGSEASK